MSNELTVLQEQEVLGKSFRVYGTLENPFFLAKDIAEWIDYTKTSEGYYNVSMMLKTVDDGEKITINNADSGGKSTFLTEEGLYEVLMQSRKPIAKEFKKEVKEILKSIRKHGAYLTPETLKKVIQTPAFIIELATALQNEQEQKMALEKQIETDKPKVNLANAITGTEDSILVASFAKLLNQNGIDIGQNRLYKWFRENEYLGKSGEYYNIPTQKARNMNLFEIKESVWFDKVGNPHINLTPLVTGKGQLYFINKLSVA